MHGVSVGVPSLYGQGWRSVLPGFFCRLTAGSDSRSEPRENAKNLVTPAPDTRRGRQGSDGINGIPQRSRRGSSRPSGSKAPACSSRHAQMLKPARGGGFPFMTDLDLAQAEREGNRRSPTAACARSSRAIGHAPAYPWRQAGRLEGVGSRKGGYRLTLYERSTCTP